jgi:adenylosuccinate lyase
LNSEPISPIDDRYYPEAKELARYFSEGALIEERVEVELTYLALLQRLGVAPKGRIPKIKASPKSVKAIEARVGHDVKAVELYIQSKLEGSGAANLSPFVHLGLTSEDTNSLAYAALLYRSLRDVMIPAYSTLAMALAKLASREASTAMLARTHGRPALPTTFGKEMAVFAVRLAERVSKLGSSRPAAKVSGAVGTYASFSLIGRADWRRAFAKMAKDMGVGYEPYSTQVVPWEANSDILHLIINLNQLMAGLSRDLWTYQTLDYVRFSRPGKVSSSTMPQKVNPVDLENAEGQAEVSIALLGLIAYKPETTRMQRDLSDSVVKRMTGQALAHSLIAAKRLVLSLGAMSVDRREMTRDLHDHPEVMAEAVQLSLRLKGDSHGYQKVKKAIESGDFATLGSYTAKAGAYLGDAPSLARSCPGTVRSLLRPRT